MSLTLDGATLAVYLLSSLRIIGWMALVPPFSTNAFPWMAKMTLALGLAFAALPQHAPQVPGNALALAAVAFTEVAIGVSMGFITYLLFAAIGAAGTMLDLFGGFAAASAFDPMTRTQSSIMGRFHQMLATALLFVTGGFLLVIGGVAKTFTLLPVGTWPKMDSMLEVMTTGFELMFTTAVEIALPLILALIVVDLGLAMMTKVAPSLNAMMVMFPLKISVTLLLVGLSLTALPAVNAKLVSDALEAIATLAGAP